MLQLTVLYPQPADVQQFEADYIIHTALLHEKMGIPPEVKPYTTLKFLNSPDGPSPFYRMFSMPFETMKTLQATRSSPGMESSCRCKQDFYRRPYNDIDWRPGVIAGKSTDTLDQAKIKCI